MAHTELVLRLQAQPSSERAKAAQKAFVRGAQMVGTVGQQKNRYTLVVWVI